MVYKFDVTFAAMVPGPNIAWKSTEPLLFVLKVRESCHVSMLPPPFPAASLLPGGYLSKQLHLLHVLNACLNTDCGLEINSKIPH